MTTTLLAAEQLLSKQLNDYWSSTTTGTNTTTAIIDSALKAKANDWIDGTKDMYDFITSVTCQYEERKISALDNSSGTLTVLAHTGTGAGTSATYEVHRLFTPSEKRIALVAAAKNIFPSCFQEVWDESLVSGNWLKDGSFEIWTSTSALTYWTKAGSSTLAQTSTAYQFKHGSYSCKISGAADNIRQSVTNNDDLKRLAGKSVTFSVQGKCDKASCLRIAIYDGTTYTYSDYHDGDSAWTEDNYPLEVTVYIQANPTVVAFIIYHADATGTSYVDDARVISSEHPRLYIGNLGLARNKPHRVEVEPSYYSQEEPWYPIRDIKVDSGGYLYLPDSVTQDYRLRIRGIGYLDFLVSGSSSTSWAATINLDAPQTEILVASAILYLYTQMALPNFTQGTVKAYQEMMGFWGQELATRMARFGMTPPPILANWGDR